MPADRYRRRAVATSVVAFVAALALAACSSASPGGSPSPSPSPSAPTTASASSSSPAPTESSSTSSSGSATSSSPSHPALHGFLATDVTFVGDDVWALGGADCLSGTGRCDAIETSHDGGVHWHSLPAPRAAIDESGTSGASSSCGAPCVAHVRFANAQVGYAWGTGENDSSFFMTTDGGTTWTPESGRVVDLESLSGNVVRVLGAAGCPPGCPYRVQLAPIGSTRWYTESLPGNPTADGAQLARVGDEVYLLLTQNPAGGAQSATSSLYVSGNDGATWVDRGEGCPPSRGHEVDSVDVSAAPDGSVSLLCRPRLGGSPFTVTSTDHGRHFRAGSPDALGSAPVTAFAAASASVLLVSSDQTYRSSDAGRRFETVGANGGSTPGQADYLGFASSTLGHAICDGGRELATTVDAGSTWTLHRF